MDKKLKIKLRLQKFMYSGEHKSQYCIVSDLQSDENAKLIENDSLEDDNHCTNDSSPVDNEEEQIQSGEIVDIEVDNCLVGSTSAEETTLSASISVQLDNHSISTGTATSLLTSSSCAPPKNKRRFCSFQDGWLNDTDYSKWLAKAESPYSARCIVCPSVFQVKYDGVKSVIQHMKTPQHKMRVQAAKISGTIMKFMKKDRPTNKTCVALAEATTSFHTVLHGHSYKSADCGVKLMPLLFKDSNIAKSITCGRTKQSKIIQNVLMPFCIEMVCKDLENNHPFSLATDASNKKNQKMFPICVQYYIPRKGIQMKVLDFFEEPNETAESIDRRISDSLGDLNLDVKNIVGYAADNANVNYGCSCSVFQKLKSKNGKLIKANCHCHVIHNAAHYALKKLPYDVETLVLKVHGEFSVSAKNIVELKSCFEFFESEFHENLRHGKTRWLTLSAAVDRLLSSWEPLKMYFIKQGEEDCPQGIWKFISDQADGLASDLTIAECYIYLVQHVMHLFTKTLLKLQAKDFTAIELYNTMVRLKADLEERRKNKFCGYTVQNALGKMFGCSKKNFEKNVIMVYDRALQYLNQWFDFENSPFRLFSAFHLRVGSAPELPTSQDCIEAVEVFDLHLNFDELFDEITMLRIYLSSATGLSKEGEPLTVVELWDDFFEKTASEESAQNLERLLEHIFALPVSNAFCERVFSLMEYAWTDARNRLETAQLKAELCVKSNFNCNCKEFYELMKEKPSILKLIASDAKYNYKKK